MDMVRNSLVETIESTGNGLNANLGQIEDRLERQQPSLPHDKGD